VYILCEKVQVKCDLDHGTMRYDVYTQGQELEKCKKVLKSVEKCDRFTISSHNLGYGAADMVEKIS